MKKWKNAGSDSMHVENYKKLEARMYEVMATVNKSIKAEELKEYLISLESAKIEIEKANIDELKRISFAAVRMAEKIIISLLTLKESIGKV